MAAIRRARRSVALATMPLLLLLSTNAHASLIEEVTLDDLTAAADCIIDANVVGIGSAWLPDSSGIQTAIQLDVQVVHAGPCATGPLFVRLIVDGTMEKRAAHAAPVISERMNLDRAGMRA